MLDNNSDKSKNNIQKIDKSKENLSPRREDKAVQKGDIFAEKTITFYRAGEVENEKDLLIKESPLTIFVNNYQLLTLMVLKENLEELVFGFLAAEGLIKKKDDILNISFKQQQTVVMVDIKSEFKPNNFKKRTLTSGCGSGSTFLNLKECAESGIINSNMQLPAEHISNLMSQLQNNAQYFKKTGGTHISALADQKEILFRMEDIGRHNTLDKLIGRAIKHGISLDDKIVLTSGRISTEMIVKVLKQGIPFLVSRSAPTEAAVNIARDRELTLIAFCRGKRMNIYSGEQRINF